MKSKILIALVTLLPFANLSAYVDEEGDAIDQLMLTMGTTVYVICKTLDLAREQGFRYVKILSAEYSLGNQTGGFTCPAENDDEGQTLSFEDEACKLSVSCTNEQPKDTDYIDTTAYQDFIHLDDEENEGASFDFDRDDEDSLE